MVLNKLKNLPGTVVLEHTLFGKSVYECEELQIIDDDRKLGVMVKNRELFVYKDKLMSFKIDGNIYSFNDHMLNIQIIVNKV